MLKKVLQIVGIILVAITFFVAYSWFSFGSNGFFNSPDETANYFFINYISETGKLNIVSDVIREGSGLVHPRSMIAFGGDLVPGSFLGLIVILGFLASIVGGYYVLFVPALIAILASLALWYLWHELFDKDIAWWAWLLLLINPAWWYYASKGLMPNILFLSLLILSIASWWRAKHNGSNFLMIVSGLCLGFGLVTRVSELLWVGILWLILWIIGEKHMNWKQTLLWIAGLVIAIIPFLFRNQALYGAWYYFAYQGSSVAEASLAHSWWVGYLQQLALPFGWKEKTILANVYNYLIKLFWWWLIPLVFSLWYIFRDRWWLKKKFVFYSAVSVLISVILVVYYGSYQTHDSIDTDLTLSIGHSFVRYWLPIFILFVPFVAIPFAHNWLKSGWRRVLVVLVFLIMLAGSIGIVYYLPAEGLIAIKNTLAKYPEQQQKVLSLTEDNSIIITKYNDKYLFPKRQIITELVDDYNFEIVGKLLEKYPVYYLSFTLPQKDIEFLNKRFAPYGVKIPSIGVGVGDGQELYKLEFKREDLS